MSILNPPLNDEEAHKESIHDVEPHPEPNEKVTDSKAFLRAPDLDSGAEAALEWKQVLSLWLCSYSAIARGYPWIEAKIILCSLNLV